MEPSSEICPDVLSFLLHYLCNIQMYQEKINPAILVCTAVEQEFQKTYGKTFDFKQLLKHQAIKKWFSDCSMLIGNSTDIDKFRRVARDALRHNPKYTINADLSEISRDNKCPDIKDYISLIKTVEKYPQGLLVDDEILRFTYKNVKSDITRAIVDKRMKRINFNSKEDVYFIFPMTIENDHEIREDAPKDYGLSFYLQICKAFNSDVQDSDAIKGTKNQSNKESASTDLNYKLPGFSERKEEWLKRSQKK